VATLGPILVASNGVTGVTKPAYFLLTSDSFATAASKHVDSTADWPTVL
jgi:hypothetical protein